MAKVSAAEKAESIRELKKLLRPGSEVQCVLRHVSASGMSRRIDFFVIKGNETRRLTYLISRVLDYSLSNKDGALVVQGCGMDMGFSVVYGLGATLWPKGTKKPHGRRNGEPDHEGGYALKHRWL